MEQVAVIGASPKEDRYSNKAMRLLAEYNHHAIPVAPGHETIEGEKVYQDISTIPDKLDTATLYLAPKRQSDEVVDQIIAASPKRVIFNPGTENPQSAEKFKAAGISVVEACTLVLLKTGQYDTAGL